MSGEGHPKIPSPPETPARFEATYADFETGERLGTGGDADVHLATVTVDGERHTVALKQPRFQGTISTSLVERFADEAETWQRLDDHPHVVTVLDWGTEPVPWLALEYMDGGSVADRFTGTPDLPQALWLGGRIADALYHGHRHGIAHLDVKPGNVLLAEREATAWPWPKISDWGLARLILEDTASIEGLSPHYAAPEQFDPDAYGEPDDRTDIYQLGAVVYELLTGRPPFTGSATTVMRATLDETPAPPSAHADVPDSLDEPVLTALATEKADRHESVLYLRDALDRAFASVTGRETTRRTTAPPETLAAPDDASETAGAPVAGTASAGDHGEGPPENETTGARPPDYGDASGPTRRSALKTALGVGAAATAVGGAGWLALRGFPAGDDSGAVQTTVTTAHGTVQTEPTTRVDDGAAGATRTTARTGDGAIPIGALVPQSGGLSPLQDAVKMLQVAVEDVDDHGGPLDRSIELKPVDTQGDPEVVAKELQRLVAEEDIVGAVGPVVGGEVAAKIAHEAGVMVVSNGSRLAGLPANFSQADPQLFARTVSDVRQTGIAMGATLGRSDLVDATSVAILHPDDSVGHSIVEAAARTAKQEGGGSVKQFVYPTDTADFSEFFEQIGTGDFDAVGFAGFGDAVGTAFRQWIEMGYEKPWVAGVTGLREPLFHTIQEVNRGLRLVTPHPPATKTRKRLLTEWSPITHRFIFAAYDALLLQALAIERAGEASGPAIARNIRAVSRSGTELAGSDFGTARELLADGKDVNYQGAAGPVDLTGRLEPVVRYAAQLVEPSGRKTLATFPPSYFSKRL